MGGGKGGGGGSANFSPPDVPKINSRFKGVGRFDSRSPFASGTAKFTTTYRDAAGNIVDRARINKLRQRFEKSKARAARDAMSNANSSFGGGYGSRISLGYGDPRGSASADAGAGGGGGGPGNFTDYLKGKGIRKRKKMETFSRLSPEMQAIFDTASLGANNALMDINRGPRGHLEDIEAGQNAFFNLQDEINQRRAKSSMDSLVSRMSAAGLENSSTLGGFAAQSAREADLVNLATQQAAIEQILQHAIQSGVANFGALGQLHGFTEADQNRALQSFFQGVGFDENTRHANASNKLAAGLGALQANAQVEAANARASQGGGLGGILGSALSFIPGFSGGGGTGLLGGSSSSGGGGPLGNQTLFGDHTGLGPISRSVSGSIIPSNPFGNSGLPVFGPGSQMGTIVSSITPSIPLSSFDPSFVSSIGGGI